MKPHNEIVLKPYLAVKLTTKLDKVTKDIRDADSNEPKLKKWKEKREKLKKRLRIL